MSQTLGKRRGARGSCGRALSGPTAGRGDLISRDSHFAAELANKAALGTNAGRIYKTLECSLRKSQPLPSLAGTQAESREAR